MMLKLLESMVNYFVLYNTGSQEKLPEIVLLNYWFYCLNSLNFVTDQVLILTQAVKQEMCGLAIVLALFDNPILVLLYSFAPLLSLLIKFYISCI